MRQALLVALSLSAVLGCVFFACMSASALPLPIRDHLSGAESVELLALHPAPHTEEGKPAEGEDFHGFRVLDRADLADEGEREELARLIARAVRRSDGTVAACFDPRHGIRARRGGEIVDFVICFECYSMIVHGPGAARESFPIARAPEPDVTRLFGRLGLQVHGGS